MVRIISFLVMMQLSFLCMAETGVTRSVITTAIENMEPVSELETVANSVSKIVFFTELSGFNGHRIVHRWEYNGSIMAEVGFDIASNRWRTWSSKNMMSIWTGIWTVSVLDEGGNLIEQLTFEYVNSEPQKQSPQPEPDT